ncbi:S9 family peptidase [Psychroserpens sp. MEBiC05023]
MKRFYALLIASVLSIGIITAQEITKEDYKRAVSFMYDNSNNKKVYNLHTTVHWFKDKSGLWFIDYSKKGKAYKTVSFSDFKVKPLFNQDKLAGALGTLLEKDIKPNDLSISNIEKTEDENLSIKVNNKLYTLDIQSYALSELEGKKKEEENKFESKSPDGKWIAFTRDYNLFIKSTENKEEYQLSTKGEKGYEYASWYGWYDKMEGENGERPRRFGVQWSKDSKWIGASIVDTRNAEKMYLLDYSIDSLYRPKLLSYYRGSPGDTTMVYIEPAFYNVESKKEIKTKLPKGAHINSVRTEWLEESGKLLADYPERGYQKGYLKLVDLNNGTEKIIIEETSDTNIDNFWHRTFDKKQKVIFLSQRSGWRQLYIVDLKTGNTKALTQGNYYINEVVHSDEKNEIIYFLASGKEENNNPYYQQLYKVDFDGKETLLTPDPVNHQVSFSEGGKYFVDNYSTVNIPTKTVLREAATGKIITGLTQADISEISSTGWQAPEVFSLTAKDEKTTIYGALWKPTNFDPNKSYPIIDHTYTGPHTQVFPNRYTGILWNQALAELGFIVMMVDGLGTAGRSKEFLNHSYKNMGNNLEDHVRAIKFLSDKYSWIDGDKVGIFGHSAGGYDTGRAMFAFPETYKVGVASSADHDFRMEKAWWPEMYQGWPVDSTYHEVSNITNAHKLKGKLLLTHGSLDDNVNPSATFKLAEALIKADKDFDLVIFPSQRHGYQGDYRKYFTKKRWNYFIEHLRGDTPIWNFNWE